MSDEMKIKRCMFCRSKARMKGTTLFYVICGDQENCCAEGPLGATEAEAIAKWNAAPRRKREEAAQGTFVYPVSKAAAETSGYAPPSYTSSDGYVYINPDPSQVALATRIEALEEALSIDRDAFKKIDPEGEGAANGSYHAWLGRVLMTQFDRLEVLEQNERDHVSIHTRGVEFMEKQAAQIEALEMRLAEVVARLYPTGMTDRELSDIVNKRPGITDIAAQVIKWAHSPKDDGA